MTWGNYKYSISHSPAQRLLAYNITNSPGSYCIVLQEIKTSILCVVNMSNYINLKLKENILLYKHIPAPIMLFILIQNTGEIKQVN